ncbi:12888_t:CDS:2 [Racocetra fulgida]|uniref:12888_t:CDS:1 n=1 Tax=Racocetra fulgida TaxID=60492 RepID=A0A9N9F4G2_9GLOM|nr:12888_t:CDS:2 [Racocetra fulgida]
MNTYLTEQFSANSFHPTPVAFKQADDEVSDGWFFRLPEYAA